MTRTITLKGEMIFKEKCLFFWKEIVLTASRNWAAYGGMIHTYIEEIRVVCVGKAVRIWKKGAGDRNPGVIIQGAFLRDKTTAFLCFICTECRQRLGKQSLQANLQISFRSAGENRPHHRNWWRLLPDKGSRIDWRKKETIQRLTAYYLFWRGTRQPAQNPWCEWQKKKVS